MFVLDQRWTPKLQGDAGELSAIEWLGHHGAAVFMPLTSLPDYDVAADLGDRLVRVQVKTSTCWRDDRWYVTLATRGGNQSWSGLVKVLDPTRCDFLFVHVGDGRRWFIPAAEIGGGSGIVMGGPKYAEYEVEPGRPLPTKNRDS